MSSLGIKRGIYTDVAPLGVGGLLLLLLLYYVGRFTMLWLFNHRELVGMWSTAAVILAAWATTGSAQAADFSVTAGKQLSTWSQADWSLTATELVQGQFQAWLALGNG